MGHIKMNCDALKAKVKAVPFWWHSIELADGVVTPGVKTSAMLAQELANMRLPDLHGKSVLDIGAWDGFFSFAAEKLGASKVLALDHYVWSMDIPAMIHYWNECKEKGIVPQQYRQMPGMWQPDKLPGKKGFDTASEALNSHVEAMVGDMMEMDVSALGQFDVVFYLGVLYHMHDPFAALKKLAQLTREIAVIESEAIFVPGYADASFFEFYETNELNGDVNNWWAPTEKALTGLCRAAGFREVRVIIPPPANVYLETPPRQDCREGEKAGTPEKKNPLHYRAVIQAMK
jgi:tRNA (mo5U34)-methyltransferase